MADRGESFKLLFVNTQGKWSVERTMRALVLVLQGLVRLYWMSDN
ncbi:hypothetical protein [Entomobacter blattae]|uniref:Uncharacterized protein n=1 Tax=Entomobacter blattae TaxID=2762277 RepID=A0A7H1NU54_9PROT|nr:hypothetical protein [Entomobacter blattae]QNT79314.1 hypothetical protein JGUZn3_21110 [Entomobacter blattae]